MRLIILLHLLFVCLVVTSPVSAQTPDSDQVVADNFDKEFSDDLLGEDDPSLISDPLQTLNRGVFWFNDKAYFYFLKPIARVYRVVPHPARTSIKNFFSNLRTPVRLINSVLQLKFEDAGLETTRFFMNSTIGLAGLFDVADKWGKIKLKDEDFGQTLGVYHIGSGPYVVLPFLGPSSLRDSGGLVADYFLDPFNNALTQNLSLSEKVGLRAGKAINDLSLDDDSYEKIKRDSLDPYLFVRAAYAQYRVAKIAH